MEDILRLPKSPYKTWKTITANVSYESYLDGCVTDFSVCPGHMCFVDDEDTKCSECDRARPETDSTDAQKMSYMPLLPRIELMVSEKEHCQKLFEYRHSIHPRPDGHIRDFYDTASYHRLCDLHGGEENLKDDIFIAVSTDGFQAFKRKSYDVWPIIGTICNLPPNMRFAVKNVLPFAFVPGPTEPTNLQSFLKPLVRELQEINKDGGVKLQFYDGSTRKVRVHLLLFTGDLPAVKKCSGLKGHNGKCPCRFCLIVGVWSPHHRHYYYPSRIASEGGGMDELFDPNSLEVRTVGQTWQTLSDIYGS